MLCVLRGPQAQTDVIEFRHLPSLVYKDSILCSWSGNQGHFGERMEKAQTEITLRPNRARAFGDK